MQSNLRQMRLGSWSCFCLPVYLCSCTHTHASLDMQSRSLVLSKGFPQHLPKSCSPLWRCFNTDSLQGAEHEFCPCVLVLLLCYMQGLEGQGKEQRQAQLCKTSFHVISVSRVTLLGLGARLEMDVALILFCLSLALTHFYPNPCLSLLNHLTLFAYLHLLAHCYSLLLATPFLAHYIMFMWCAFHSFISVIRYRLPIPLLLSHGTKIAPLHL